MNLLPPTFMYTNLMFKYKVLVKRNKSFQQWWCQFCCGQFLYAAIGGVAANIVFGAVVSTSWTFKNRVCINTKLPIFSLIFSLIFSANLLDVVRAKNVYFLSVTKLAISGKDTFLLQGLCQAFSLFLCSICLTPLKGCEHLNTAYQTLFFKRVKAMQNARRGNSFY